MPAFKFSANTGYLWRELPFLERIQKTATHGFDGVEFHDEAQTCDRTALRNALAETGLPVFSLNVRIGKTFGCAALPAAREQARRDIDQAIEVAEDVDAGAIHVLAGITSDANAHQTYLENLQYALDNFDRTILIEPVCAEQVPDYYLRTIELAADILEEVGHPRLKIMFDCFHIHSESGDVRGQFANHSNKIGHVQISAVEGRAEPFPGILDYSLLLPEFQKLGYFGPFGCEYRPANGTENGLSWMESLRL